MIEEFRTLMSLVANFVDFVVQCELHGVPNSSTTDDAIHPCSSLAQRRLVSASYRHCASLPFQTKSCHIQLGLGARSQDSGFLELGSAGFSSMERLVQ